MANSKINTNATPVASGASLTSVNDNETWQNLTYQIDRANVASSYVNDNLRPMLEALMVLADAGSMEHDSLVLRVRLILRLAKLGVQLVNDMAGDFESEAATLTATLKSFEGGAA